MGKFGEDLRMERISRGIALEDITAVTKISQRHLLALEQEHFRLLPGGILSKGIIRGYASAVGLDQGTWTERFMKACTSSGQDLDDDRNWAEFASNVGKSRILKREAAQMRLRWIGVAFLLLIVTVAAFFTLRYYGYRAGWWSSLFPTVNVHPGSQTATGWVHSLFARLSAYFAH
jgi:cytoskeletal protein RodZ